MLGGVYALSYSVLYFNPCLVHRQHSFRDSLAARATHFPAIVAHRGGMLALNVGSMEMQENTIPAFANAVRAA